MADTRYCLDCGEALQGRIDKKFCDDQCRSNYNNRRNSETNNYVRQINNILKRNRRIMEELNPTGKTRISKGKLLARGFNFSYFTSLYHTYQGKTYSFCYEFGYLQLDNDEVLLVRRDEG